MSTILKALRRLEQDRNPLGSRPLREAVTSGRASPGRARRTRVALFAVLGVCVVAGAGALAFLSVGQPSPAPQVAASTAARSPAVAASTPAPSPAHPVGAAKQKKRARLLEERAARAASAGRPTTTRVPTAAPRGLPPQALTSDVQVVKRPLPEPRLADPDAASEAEAETLAAAPRAVATREEATARAGTSERAAATPRRAAPATQPVPERQPAAEPAAQPAPVAERVARAKPAPSPEPVARAQAAPTPAPEAAKPAAPASSPPIARALVPSVRVEETRWHPDAARRTALVEVNGGTQQVKEGDAIGPLVVSTIEPSGVVFSHDGIEMRRRVGE